ncbi:MAG: cell division protein FtsA [Synergistaceae bacterium]|nr:cell division protein FtsA [Synergistaceae bacterium]
MNREPEILAGLDVGTTKIAVIVAERESASTAQIIGIGTAAAQGMRKGVIVNFEQAVRSVRRAVRETQIMVGLKVDSATVSFSGTEIHSFISRGMVSLGRVPRPVATSDIDRVIEAAQSELVVPANMFALHTIPTKYTIDNNVGIDDPLGMTGLRLEMELQTVAVPNTVVQNIVNCVEAAGVNVEGILVKPLASALGSLTQDEMERGVVSICIGGGTTSLAFYSEGRPMKMLVIPIGGDHITNDLAYVLRLPIGTADKLKEKLFSDGNEVLELENGDLHRNETINSEAAIEVISCRLEDLFVEHVAPYISSFGAAMFPGGVVLSGGVSKTPGIDELVSNILKLPVRIGVPLDYRVMPKGCHDSSYVNLDGVLRYILLKEKNPYRFIETPISQLSPKGFLTRVNQPGLKTGEKSSQSVANIGVIVGKIKKSLKELF